MIGALYSLNIFRSCDSYDKTKDSKVSDVLPDFEIIRTSQFPFAAVSLCRAPCCLFCRFKRALNRVNFHERPT